MPFTPDPSLAFVPVAREQLVALVESINQPQVQVPGKSSQQVVGHLAGIRNPNGSFSIYVSLHLPKTGENVIYVHERRQLGLDAYRDVELEGLQFLESMGFMLDNLNFRNLSPEAQQETLGRIPLFSPPRAAAAAPAAPSQAAAAPDPARLARLLASL